MPAAYTPTEVATMLGVSDATLRRMARSYERVYGPLPTDMRQARVYSDDVLKRLESARELVDKGRVPSFDRALDMMAAGDATLDELLVMHPPSQRAFDLLRGELREMIRFEVNASFEKYVVTLEDEIAALREALNNQGWEPQGSNQAEYVARLEQLYAEADKRAQYAMSELKRRDELAQAKRRGWWPWGKR